MSARETLRRRITAAAGRDTPSAEAARTAYEAAVSASAPRPQWTATSRARFTDRLEAAAASVEVLPSAETVPEAVGRYLARVELSPHLHLAPHPLLDGLSWPVDWEIRRGTGKLASSRLTVTVARCGIAETGTLMIPGYPATPPSMNLLAEHSLVVLSAADIVEYQEQAWAGLRKEHAALPRAVMLVTGPSRTADIEQTLQLGAHGPRKLHVLLLEKAAPP